MPGSTRRFWPDVIQRCGVNEMSYYQGDYYRGDPGFLSFLGKGLSYLGGMIPGVGGVVSKVGGVLGRIGSRAKGTTLAKAVLEHPTLTAAGAAGATGVGLGLMGHKKASMTPASLGGMHGAMRAGGRGGGGHRRMHVTNVKALRRSLR